MKGLKYEIVTVLLSKHKVTVLLSKHKINGDIEYALVYFNSETKTVVNSDKYDLGKSFQDVLHRIDNWIN